ncbi:MAG: YfhO family protein [Planctomycetaceae bacterium]|jgi:hypothetical protein|nr:YfhO family protein [Planctomycetaceae bacterium]
MNTPESSSPASTSDRAFAVLRKLPWWVSFCVILLLCAFFHNLLFRGERTAFRDGAFFYPPLFEYIQTRWKQGHPPLWNPYENLGQPLLANPVCSVFYPGKLIYALPFSAAEAYTLYLMGHFLLASFTAYKLARHFGCSVYASGLSAIAYVFGGSVLFQYSNVVFLVGAAWLPEAIRHGDRLLTARTKFPAVCLGAVLAMMVLGGDPQSAYHSLILIGLLGFCYRCEEKNQTMPRHPIMEEWTSSRPSGVFFSRRPVLLTGAVLLGMCLAAVQWMPSLDYGLQGDRTLEDKPVSLWNVPAAVRRMQTSPETSWRDVRDGLLANNHGELGIAGTRYNYSVSPWRLTEWVWPNASGRMFPLNTRWTVVTPMDLQIWTPSLYMGVIPFLLALIGLRFRKHEAVTHWLSWGMLVFTLGAFGIYGLGWMVNHVAVILGYSPAKFGIGNAFGGVYWLMNLLLPGYDLFRYPAKLMTAASLCLAILAGRTYDRCFGLYSVSTAVYCTDFVLKQRKYRRRFLFCSQMLLIVSLVLIPFVLIPKIWLKLYQHLPEDPHFGQFQIDRAISEATFSLLHVINILLVLIVALRLYVRSKGANVERSGVLPPLAEQQRIHNRYFGRLGCFVLILVSLDLLFSNHWMIASAPENCFEGQPSSYGIVKPQTDSSLPHSPVRLWRAPVTSYGEPPWFPAMFITPSHDRLAETVRWQRAAFFPKYPLPYEIGVVDTRGTLMYADSYAVSQMIRNAWSFPDNIRDKHNITFPDIMKCLGISWIVIPDSDPLQEQEESEEAETVIAFTGPRMQTPQNTRICKVAAEDSPAYITYHPELTDPVVFESRKTYFARTFRIFAKVAEGKTVIEWDGKRLGGMPLEFSRAFMACVSTDSASRTRGKNAEKEKSADRDVEACELVRYEPENVVLRAVLTAPGFLVLADQYDTHWKATVRAVSGNGEEKPSQEIPIFRVNRVMRGVPLPKGHWEVSFYYDPLPFRAGTLLSMIGWLFLGFYFVSVFLKRKAAA